MGGLLVQAEYIAGGIPEPCSDFGRVRADRLCNLTTICDNCLDGPDNTVNHYVYQQARLGCGRAAEHPGAADFADPIVECSITVSALPCLPAKDFLVEFSRALNVGSRDLDIAYFAVFKSGHR